jgi:hypothetical protein
MRKVTTALTVAALMGFGAAAQAEEGMVTVKRADEYKGAYDSPVNVDLRIGSLAYQESVGDESARAAYGLTFRWNASHGNPTNLYYGVQTGFLFSHLGAPTSNFFGTDASGSPPGADANATIFPINLIVGYQVNDQFLITGHGGASMLYRSNSSAMLLGRGETDTSDSFEVFPALGIMAGYELGRNIALTAQGDFTFTPQDDIWAATLGLSFGIG